MGDVQTTLEALMAVPEPDGVRLHRMPPWLEQDDPGALTVEVGQVYGTAGPAGRGEHAAAPLPIGLDRAHDLSWRGPEVYVWPETGGQYGVTRWTVYALGFIEHEARTAFRAVCAVIDGRVRTA